MGMQDLIAIGCVLCAGVFFLKKTVVSNLMPRRKGRSSNCGSGCGKCSDQAGSGGDLVSIGIGGRQSASK